MAKRNTSLENSNLPFSALTGSSASVAAKLNHSQP